MGIAEVGEVWGYGADDSDPSHIIEIIKVITPNAYDVKTLSHDGSYTQEHVGKIYNGINLSGYNKRINYHPVDPFDELFTALDKLEHGKV